MAKKAPKANKAAKQDADRRKHAATRVEKALSEQPSAVADDLKAFHESSHRLVDCGLIDVEDSIELMELVISIQEKVNARLEAELARRMEKTI